MTRKNIKVAIIGRPNVGKSTLFNRLVGRRRALVHNEPGVTRDRLEETTKWWVGAKPFSVTLIDTGGLGGERFAEEIKKQVAIAVEAADAVVMLFDAQAGLTPADRELIREMRQTGLERSKPVFGVVNKVDVEVHETLGADFYAASFARDLLTISAEHGRGIDELKQVIIEASDACPDEDGEVEADEKALPKVPRIAIVGRPNVGKSTMVNALLGSERMITSPIAGTTVDAVDSLVSLGGKPFVLLDTAGIRRKSKTEQGVEVLSVVQAKKALERSDVAILLLDGETGITDQDEKIGGMIEEVGCSVVLAVNKWDTQRSNHDFTSDIAAKLVRSKMAYLKYAPLMFVSAKENAGFEDLGDLIADILHQRAFRITTHEFTEWIRKESTINNPANAKFYLCHQSGRHPPTFVCHVNDPEKIHFSLKRHLVNALRERWGFMGSPVRLLFIEAKNRKSLPKPSRATK